MKATDTFEIIATFTAIAPTNLELFKSTVSQAVELAASEEGTLEYAYFLNADETRCLMIESYANSEAFRTHMEHVGHLMGTLFESGGSVDINILGKAPRELIEATKDSHPTLYTLFAGA